jgi:hypothetical protein
MTSEGRGQRQMSVRKFDNPVLISEGWQRELDRLESAKAEMSDVGCDPGLLREAT